MALRATRIRPEGGIHPAPGFSPAAGGAKAPRGLKPALRCLGAIMALAVAPQPAAITIDYPQQGSIFPPEITPPAFLWRDPVEGVAVWRIEIKFAGGAPVRAESRGERLPIGEIDPRAVSETNQPPQWNPQIAAAHSWTPAIEMWETIKRRSVQRPATVTITGYREEKSKQAVSRGEITIQTSKDPVGAPIFYRDVPLMPSELERGVIKPLAAAAVPLIGWRLRDVGEPKSRLLLEGLHTCANCHSFSRDGKTLGMDLDGPGNDKGMYAIVPLAPQTTIRNEDVVNWGSFRGKLGADLRVGFMSQVSPDGRHVVTMIDRPDAAAASRARAGRGHFYVANFKDYRFLQVFYPTRGILAWYSRATGRLDPLPGADDPRYVQTNAVWSPDGSYLVFARAEARDPYPEGGKPAEFANDPNETPIQYGLYRIPFNDGQGGRAEPIAGASRNGMSNSFPKVSPDGRWVVFVQCRNGQLMRSDSRLFIVPVNGGPARLMRANLPVMNSWHSFSPNGRWLVFSSKTRSPYTQMYLTHLDENGSDSPAILIDNATAANRAVNIPEFVNIPPGGLARIDVPAVEYYRRFDLALDLARKGRHEEAVAEWKKAMELGPDDASVHMNLGVALAGSGRLDEAIAQYRKALELSPDNPETHLNFGIALAGKGDLDQAVAHYRKALEINPDYPEAHNNLGVALAAAGKLDEAIGHYQQALAANPDYPEVHNNFGVALARAGRLEEAISHFRKVLEAKPDSADVHNNLGRALATLGRMGEAIAQWREVLRLAPDHLPILTQTAWTLATSADASLRNGAEAVALAERAAKLSAAREPVVLDTLAAAYAEAGRFPEAVETARRALALANERNDQPLAEAIQARIALYEAGTPWRRAP
jgi:Flp pilus assembly protein TadD